MVCAKKYLARAISLKTNCETFNDLRYEIYMTKEKALNELPPTSGTICGYLMRSHYFVYLCSNLLDSSSNILKPAMDGSMDQWSYYGWIINNGLLAPTKNFATIPSYLTTKCCCKKGCTKNWGCNRTFEKCTEYCDSTNCKNVLIFGTDLVSPLMPCVHLVSLSMVNVY